MGLIYGQLVKVVILVYLWLTHSIVVLMKSQCVLQSDEIMCKRLGSLDKTRLDTVHAVERKDTLRLYNKLTLGWVMVSKMLFAANTQGGPWLRAPNCNVNL